MNGLALIPVLIPLLVLVAGLFAAAATEPPTHTEHEKESQR